MRTLGDINSENQDKIPGQEKLLPSSKRNLKDIPPLPSGKSYKTPYSFKD
jgi:hypothetical protein